MVHINKQNFDSEVKSSNLPVVVDAYAVWCGPCQHMGPIFEELSDELKAKYKFVKLNIDEARDLAIDFGVSSVPTFIFLKDGMTVGKAIGYMSKDALEDKINDFLG